MEMPTPRGGIRGTVSLALSFSCPVSCDRSLFLSHDTVPVSDFYSSPHPHKYPYEQRCPLDHPSAPGWVWQAPCVPALGGWWMSHSLGG